MIFNVLAVIALVFYALVIFLQIGGFINSNYTYRVYKKDGKLKKVEGVMKRRYVFRVFSIIFEIVLIVLWIICGEPLVMIAGIFGIATIIYLFLIPTRKYFKLIECFEDYETRIQELDMLIDGNPFVSFEQLHFSNNSKRFKDETVMDPFYQRIKNNIQDFNVVLGDMRKDCLKIKERLNLRIKSVDLKSIGRSDINLDFNDYIDSTHFDKQDRMQNEINKNIVNYRRIFAYADEVDKQLTIHVRPIDRLYEERDVRNTGIQYNYSLYLGLEYFQKIYGEYLKAAEDFDKEFEVPYKEYDMKIEQFMRLVYQSIRSGKCDVFFDPSRYRLNMTKSVFDAMMTAQKRVDAYCRSIEEDCDKIRNLLRQITFTRKEYNANQFEFILKLSNDQEINSVVTRYMELIQKYDSLFASQKGIMKKIEKKYTDLIYSGQTINMLDVKNTIARDLKEHLNYRKIEEEIEASYNKLKTIKEEHPNLLFELAIKEDDIAQLDRILEQTKEVYAVDVDGNNLIHFCAKSGAYKCYQRLSNFDISQTIGNKAGLSPIDLAQPDNAVYGEILRRTTNGNVPVFNVSPVKPSSVIGKPAFKDSVEGIIAFNESLISKTESETTKTIITQQNMTLQEIVDYSIKNGPNQTKSDYNLKQIDPLYLNFFKNALEYAKEAIKPLEAVYKCRGYYRINIDAIYTQLEYYVQTLNMAKIAKIEKVARAICGLAESSFILERKYSDTLYAEIGLRQNPDFYHRQILYCYSLLIIKRLVDEGDLVELKDELLKLFTEKAEILVKLYKENPEPEAFKILVEFDPELESELDENDKFYKILGLTKDATISEVKKAYRRKTLEHHKDRGGDGEMIALLNEAYSRLLILGKEK